MAITFYLQSKNNPATIYARVREGREIDAKAKTNLKIDPTNFKKGKVKLKKTPSGSDIKIKKKVQEYNEALNGIQENLDLLRSKITIAINQKKEYETLNSGWLKDLINPKRREELPSDIIGYFDHYLVVRSKQLRQSTLKKIGVFRNRMEAFQNDYGTVYIPEVNKKLGLAIERWCDKRNYAHNTKLQTLKILKTVCNHAKESGIPTHPELEYLTKGHRYKKSEHIHLNLDEIDSIAEANFDDEPNSDRLEIARDWLIISCFTAQRVSDFLKFTSKDIKFIKGKYYLQIKQKKTEKAVNIPLTDITLEIILKYDGNFPPVFSKNEGSNSAMYNKLIKDVCRIAKIEKKVKVERKNKNTNRYEVIEVPKYKAVSTHIGRRSFATNFHTKIDTPLLIAATGHSSETQFLRYVSGTGNHNAVALGNAMETYLASRKQEPKLEVVREASNQN